MSKISLFDLLREGDIDNCHKFIDQASLGGEELVKYLNTLLYFSASLKWSKNIDQHPLIVVNSIKNIISDNRDNPSKILLYYCLEILSKESTRDNDNKCLDEIKKDGVGSTVFIGNLESAIQSGEWEEAKILAANIFLASDPSRAVIDIITDFGLQNIEDNGLFIFHLLRAFYFKQEKSQTWTYACCLIDVLKTKPLPEPSIRQDIQPDKLFDRVIYYYNTKFLETYTAVLRIWNGGYVRQDSYNREISHWLHSKQFYKDKIVNEKRSELVLDHDIDYNNFINIAEVIISKGNTIVESSKGIITLEALRYIEKIRKNKYFHDYVNRLVSP